jgi:lipid II:glycine glycyltransferase (peptidoglycan interpeptide bridge formation enzyme)
MYIKELTNDEFIEFTSSFPYKSFYQTPEYAFVMNNDKNEAFFLGLKDDNYTLAACLIIVEKRNGFKYAYTPRGFLINFNDYTLLNEFTKLLKEFLGKKDIVALKINPMLIRNIYNNNKQIIYKNKHYDSIFEQLIKLGYNHCGYNDYFEAIKPRFEAILNIKTDEKDLYQNIDKNYRKKIKNAIENGIHIYKGNFNELKYLYEQSKYKYPRSYGFLQDIYRHFDEKEMVELYYAKLNTEEYLINSQKEHEQLESETNEINNKIMEDLHKDKTKLINKKLTSDSLLNKYENKLITATSLLQNNPNGIVLASTMVIKYYGTIYMFMDGYDQTYRYLNAKHLLLWKIIEEYSKKGFKKFNLGGISNINKEDKFKGLNEFRMNFGACAIEYAGDFELVTNNTLYFMYKKTEQITKIIKKKNN